MTSQFFFLSIAGLALSVMGFAGIVTAFRRRTDGWTRTELWRLQKIVEISTVTMFLALLTFPLHLLTDERVTVGVLSVLLGAYVVVNMAGALRDAGRFGPDRRWVRWYVFIGSSHAGVAFAAAVTGLVPLLMLGLLLLLHHPVALFARTVVEFAPAVADE